MLNFFEDPAPPAAFLNANAYGKVREFPLDDVGKPNKSPDIKKLYRPEGFLGSLYGKAGIFKLLFLHVKHKRRERLRYVRKHHLYKVAVVLCTNLLRNEKAALLKEP